MMYKLLFTLTLLISCLHQSQAQQASAYPLDSLKKELMAIDTRVNQIELKLDKTQRSFKRGIFLATMGYTITIAGGLMLGRENDSLGQFLLYTGGVLGATGTVMLVNSFQHLKREKLYARPETSSRDRSLQHW